MVGLVLCYLQMGLHLWRGDKEAMADAPMHPAMARSRANKKRVNLWKKLDYEYEYELYSWLRCLLW